MIPESRCGIDLSALLRTPSVDSSHGFDLSPDGTKVAFAWNLSGRWEIYELELDPYLKQVDTAPVSRDHPLRPLTLGPGAKFGPKYAPDGKRLAYVVDFDGSESFQIFVCDLASGNHTHLTPGTTEALQPNLAWSPDGQEIAFLSDRSGCFGAYALPSTGGSARLLLDVGHPAGDISWSANGQWLAVTLEMGGQDYGIFLVSAAGGESWPISAAGRPVNAQQASWSPDSAMLAFVSDPEGFSTLGLYDLHTQEIIWDITGEQNKEQPAWSSDGRDQAFVVSQGITTWLAVRTLGQSPKIHQVEPGIHTSPKFIPGDEQLLFVFDNPRHPPDLWRLDLRQGSFQQLTQSLPLELAHAEFVMPEEIHYPGGEGQSVPALLYRPVRLSEPHSAVVSIHGGPNWQYQAAWNPLMSHLASRGWVVLGPNYRGSTGYGRRWQLANRFDLGGGDTDDVAAGAIYLVREGLVAPGQLAVTGRSHGGYLTMTCLTRYPDLWAAGSAVVPFLNWFTSHACSREDVQHWDIENFGDPQKDHDLWYARSPAFFLDRVNVPVQFICGAHDQRCPATECLEARDRLLDLGKSVELLLYSDEGHSFLKIDNIVDADMRRVAFLARVLEKER